MVLINVSLASDVVVFRGIDCKTRTVGLVLSILDTKHFGNVLLSMLLEYLPESALYSFYLSFFKTKNVRRGTNLVHRG